MIFQQQQNPKNPFRGSDCRMAGCPEMLERERAPVVLVGLHRSSFFFGVLHEITALCFPAVEREKRR